MRNYDVIKHWQKWLFCTQLNLSEIMSLMNNNNTQLIHHTVKKQKQNFSFVPNHYQTWKKQLLLKTTWTTTIQHNATFLQLQLHLLIILLLPLFLLFLAGTQDMVHDKLTRDSKIHFGCCVPSVFPAFFFLSSILHSWYVWQWKMWNDFDFQKV